MEAEPAVQPADNAMLPYALGQVDLSAYRAGELEETRKDLAEMIKRERLGEILNRISTWQTTPEIIDLKLELDGMNLTGEWLKQVADADFDPDAIKNIGLEQVLDDLENGESFDGQEDVDATNMDISQMLTPETMAALLSFVTSELRKYDADIGSEEQSQSDGWRVMAEGESPAAAAQPLTVAGDTVVRTFA